MFYFLAAVFPLLLAGLAFAKQFPEGTLSEKFVSFFKNYLFPLLISLPLLLSQRKWAQPLIDLGFNGYFFLFLLFFSLSLVSPPLLTFPFFQTWVNACVGGLAWFGGLQRIKNVEQRKKVFFIIGGFFFFFFFFGSFLPLS